VKALAKHEEIAKQLLDLAGITVNGDKPYGMQVCNEQLYQRIVTAGAPRAG